MIVKATVTPEEKFIIEETAKAEGMSVSSYVKRRALSWTDPDHTPLMRLIEDQAPVLQRINELATTSIQNKVIFETEILELLECTRRIEDMTAAAMKEAL